MQANKWESSYCSVVYWWGEILSDRNDVLVTDFELELLQGSKVRGRPPWRLPRKTSV